MSRSLAIIALCFAGACTEPQPIEVVAHGPTSTIMVDQASYTPGQTIVTSWTGLPGNANDWIAIAPAGSPATTVTSWTYAGGAMSGMHDFAAPAAGGNYVARSFVDDSYTMAAESASFAITSSSVVTDQTSYIVGQPVVVSWTGLPGNATDWISIAPDGSDPQTITFWVYTGGGASGMTTFANVGAGSWVARAYLDNSYTLLASSTPFTVGVPTTSTVTTDKSSYYFEEGLPIISWAGLPPGPKHWVAIAPQGSPLTTVMRWAYTGGQASGSVVLDFGAGSGPFVARAFLNDTYVLADESDPFVQIARVTTNKSTYFGGESITVSVGGLPGHTAQAVHFEELDGTIVSGIGGVVVPNGSVTIMVGITAPGTYVAVVGNNLGKSDPFTVAGNPIMLTSSPSVYQISPFGEVSVTWLNLPGPPPQWIAVAPVGSPDTTVVRWKYISGVNGTTDLLGPVAPGQYVIRAFVNDSYQKVGETVPFTAQ